jgi:hypothetical protein
VIQEAAITINGTRLTGTESATVRAAMDTFTFVLAQRIEAGDKEMTDAATEDYLRALTRIRGLLESATERIQ